MRKKSNKRSAVASRSQRLGRTNVALTIAGSDSGGGAGIQADLKTFAAHGVYGTSVVTAVTAQNTISVTGVEELSIALIRKQLDAVATDFSVDCAKTGMLSSAAVVRAVARGIRRHGLTTLVVDPVMIAKSGDHLLKPTAIRALRSELLPLASVVTPNLPEAEVLVGFPLDSKEAWRRAAKMLVEMGASAVVIKGGHDTAEEVEDLLFTGRRFRRFLAPRLHTVSTHGTGCTFSAAICAGLAKGISIERSVERAKVYLHRAIREAPGLGAGHGPVHHFAGSRPWRIVK